MSLLLLFGGSGPTPPPAGVPFDTLGVELLFEVSESPPFAESQVWHDFTGYLFGGSSTLDTTRGRSSEFDDIQTGTLGSILDATNGDLDRRNPSTPLADCLQPRRRCRLRAIHNEVAYPIFYGFTHGFPRTYSAPNNQALVPFRASEGFRVMGTADPTGGIFTFDDDTFGLFDVGLFGGSTAAQQYSGQLIAALADSIAWPSDLRDIDTGRVLVDGDLGESQRADASMREANDAEGGDLYISRDGLLTFRDRLRRYTDARSTAAQATFSPRRSNPPAYDEPFRIEHDDTRFTNSASYTGTSGVPQIAEDTDSINEFGIGEDSKTVIAVIDGDVLALAQLRVTDYATPEDRVEELVIRLHDPTHRATTLPAVLALELFDRVDVVLASTYGEADESLPAVVQGISHRISKSEWVTTLKLGPYKPHDLFTFDDDTLSLFDGVGVFAP